jgi:molybdenum cofactor biosynthesis enzyme MoaA
MRVWPHAKRPPESSGRGTTSGTAPEVMDYLTRDEIAAWQPDDPGATESALTRARRRMEATAQWRKGQPMGRRFAVGCVALEITQRCNLDCTLCYLSENSESVLDVPLPEIFRRIDQIHAIYGDNCDVQVTGGDPTLRNRNELVAIVRRIAALGMRPSLITNGIRARRELLAELAAAGLVDVAFHVDDTQQRRGYADELALNALRRLYIDRARGLGISVMFNTTVHQGNFAQVPALVRFFVDHADVVRLASFQLQADTGRGIAGARPLLITPDTMARLIEEGVGTSLNFGTPIGHARCNRYAASLVTGGRVHDLLDDQALVADVLDASTDIIYDRRRPRRSIAACARWAVMQPWLWRRGLVWAARKLWAMRHDVVRGRGRVHKLSFLIHNFMDACALERDRVEACIFMAMTARGPVSMCLHNARRDSFILEPVEVETRGVKRRWHPLSGFTDAPTKARRVPAKGRARLPRKALP